MWPLYDLGTRYPRRLSEMSLDYKLMFVYHISMMMLFAARRALSVEMELTFAAVLATGLSVLAIKHRRAAGWRWPGAGAREMVAALTTAALVGIFLFAATPIASTRDPVMLPWYLAGLGIGLFLILMKLRLVRMSQIDFEADCHGASSVGTSAANVATPDMEPAWKRRVRAGFSALFLLVWLDGMAFFYVHGNSRHEALTVRTGTHSEPLVKHGRIVYITPAQDQLRSVLGTVMMVGIPLMLASALVLEKWAGVQLSRRSG